MVMIVREDLANGQHVKSFMDNFRQRFAMFQCLRRLKDGQVLRQACMQGFKLLEDIGELRSPGSDLKTKVTDKLLVREVLLAVGSATTLDIKPKEHLDLLEKASKMA